MADTIELLEAIGRDASLRHATADALAAVLERAKASHALTAAAATGDSAHLKKEFDYRLDHVTQSSQTFPIML
ncbi:hypothetical protein [Dyella silvae]|uniref:hypothetical protein n=1 Tax=Dyella silvae TaxID=2994424 RepID=UPI002263CC99|nr:hypothetical protein [Dyella silvae]